MTGRKRRGKHSTEWITLSTDEYDSMRQTIEVLSDKNLMQQIKVGKKDRSNIRDFEEVAQELGI